MTHVHEWKFTSQGVYCNHWNCHEELKPTEIERRLNEHDAMVETIEHYEIACVELAGALRVYVRDDIENYDGYKIWQERAKAAYARLRGGEG